MLLQLKSARLAGAPLVAIQTPDPAATMKEFADNHGETDDDDKPFPPPIISYDLARGFVPQNEAGKEALVKVTGATQIGNYGEALQIAVEFPRLTVLFFLNAHRQLTDNPNDALNVQAAWNLRDPFKATERTAIFFGPQIMFPPELMHDVLVLDEPLPNAKALEGIARSCYEAGDVKEPSGDDLRKVVDAVSGLAAFPAEQAISMSMKRSGVNVPALWERKRGMIEQTKGLSVWRGTERFSDIGGLGNIKTFLTNVIGGEKPPRAFIFIDEIEKAISPDGDLSGTSKDQLGVLLSFMQDNDSAGLILIGPPGTGKSALAKAAGNEGDVLTIPFDFGGMKAGIVGESETTVRNALKVCKAIGGDGLVFIATCNSIGSLPPELRRRFTMGTFFMDLPDAEERKAIWKQYLAKFKLEGKRAVLPDDTDWTGAEIRQACDLAWRLRTTVQEAAKFVVPVARAAAEQIESLRTQAHGRYIAASKPGLYEKPAPLASPAPVGIPASGPRKMKPQAED